MSISFRMFPLTCARATWRSSRCSRWWCRSWPPFIPPGGPPSSTRRRRSATSRGVPEAILRCSGLHKSFGPPSNGVEVLRELGFVFQFHHLLPEFSALENAMMPLLVRGEPRGRARAKASVLLEELGLSACLDRRPPELSGGEQQRVAIVRALVGAPSLLLADEPTGNLDERNAGVVFELLLDLHRRRGMTTVLVTHSARLAGRCSRILRMEEGSLTPSATTHYNSEAGATQVSR